MNSIPAFTSAGFFNKNPKKQAGFRVFSFSWPNINIDFVEFYFFKLLSIRLLYFFRKDM